MIILGVDPGTTQSGWVRFDTEAQRPIASGIDLNHAVLEMLENSADEAFACELVASFGMAVGKEVFTTVRWTGRFQQAWRQPDAMIEVFRKDVKLNLCGSMIAKDQNIRLAIIDRLGPQGTKRQQGPTYGIKSHIWSALAVALTASDRLDGRLPASAPIPHVDF